MVSNKVIVGIVAVAAIVVLVLALAGGSDEPQARYNYSVEVVDSFETDSGYIERSSPGEDFAILTITIANDSYSDGITTNDFINCWKIIAGGVSKLSCIESFSHPLYLLGDIMVGSTVTYALVFEVPEGTSVDEIQVTHEWIDFTSGPRFVRDEAL